MSEAVLGERIREWTAATETVERDRLEKEISELARPIATRAATARGIVGADVADVAQETCYRLLEMVRKGGGPASNAEGLVWRIADHLAVDVHRRRKRVSAGTERLLAEAEAQGGATVDPRDIWAATERQLFAKEAVRKALESAPENYRRVIELHYYDGVPIEEIADLYYREAAASGAVEESDPNAVAVARKQARNRVDQHLKRGRDWLGKRILQGIDEVEN